jgi:hypothetical protein
VFFTQSVSSPFKTFHAGPVGWTEIQLPDGTIS